MRVIEELKKKKKDLEKRLSGQSNLGSQYKESLRYKIEKIEELISCYRNKSTPIDLSEAKKILDQQIGFEAEKKKILENLEIIEFLEKKNITKNDRILCFIGPTGVGKTTFAQIMAQAMNKQFYLLSLAGLNNRSVLLGTNENSSEANMGTLAKALVETKVNDPLILLDEIDKSSIFVQNCLVNVLDSSQNKSILDYYLDIKLDFSRITFVITANDEKKIPDYILSRALVIKLEGYTIEQKEFIANKIIQNWFEQNKEINHENFSISSEAIKTLINKTKEKGVRKLKMLISDIFDYCFLKWSREDQKKEPMSKISVDTELVNQLIPGVFFEIENSDNKDDEKFEKIFRKLGNLQNREKEITHNQILTNKLPDKFEKLQENQNKNKYDIKKNFWIFSFFFSAMLISGIFMYFINKSKNSKKIIKKF